MAEKSESKPAGGEPLSRAVGEKAERKARARRRPAHSVWQGFAFFGLIGWSIVVPTLFGAALGAWLDRRHPGGRSWTLALLIAGLVLGCLNAWHWVAKEHRDMRKQEEEAHHDPH